MKSPWIGLCAAAVLCAGGRAAAQAPSPRYGGAFRHQGFYLNLDLGLGYLRSSISSIDERWSGGAGQFSIGIGGAIQENLILAGRLWAYSVPDPDATIGGVSGTVPGGSLTLTGIGPELVYYVMPANVYLSIAPSLTTLSPEGTGLTYSIDTGVGLRLAVGKEWWVAPHVGIGLNGNLAVASNKEPGFGTWGSFAIGVAFSATFN